jgi:hypothetical protein
LAYFINAGITTDGLEARAEGRFSTQTGKGGRPALRRPIERLSSGASTGHVDQHPPGGRPNPTGRSGEATTILTQGDQVHRRFEGAFDFPTFRWRPSVVSLRDPAVRVATYTGYENRCIDALKVAVPELGPELDDLISRLVDLKKVVEKNRALLFKARFQPSLTANISLHKPFLQGYLPSWLIYRTT